ncbi:di-heme oxidoreductase family protein [Algicola sagamiensis]|uniref:di-heme oxidoreductase family protein n=1 Tax=Algicola sagamiensis TaxID=163869 RepID=UPI000369F049|nr:di-heme oxidoredictase family protein [Algicola sagamiensis]
MRLSKKQQLIVWSSIFLINACGGSDSPKQENNKTDTLNEKPAPTEYLSGGQNSTPFTNKNAFQQLTGDLKHSLNPDASAAALAFKVGNDRFRNPQPHLGPLKNADTCRGCHIRDGRGSVPGRVDAPMETMFLRVSNHLGEPEKTYGGQLQTFAQAGGEKRLPKYRGSLDSSEVYGEAFAFIEFEEMKGKYDDGTEYSLRKPTYFIKDPAYGDFEENVRFSPRVTPSIFGSGLLEAIPDEQILANADPEDKNKDGISGRPAYAAHWKTKEKQLARFGYKLGNATVLQQSAGAFRGDMGQTSSIFPDEPCTQNQQACIEAAAKEPGVDITNETLRVIEHYTRMLAVPNRRGYDADTTTWDPQVLAGRKLFIESDCASCHQPSFQTGQAKVSDLGDGEINLSKAREYLSNQIIFPFSDLLLHDMGGSCEVVREDLETKLTCDSGEQCAWKLACDGLADGRPFGDASGSEWRTAPLWGLGLVQTVNKGATFLHDGRARTIEEAILWHGGEGSKSRDKFKALNKSQREQMLVFLRSL